jgi:hypothetical protein
MNATRETSREERILLIGASRGLGYAIAEKYLELSLRPGRTQALGYGGSPSPPMAASR